MPNLKEVRNRISSVISTQQITKAMKMVSASKLRKAQGAINQMKPYTLKLQEIIQNLVSNLEGDLQLKLAEERNPEKVLIVLITSDKGLCGGYNQNLIKRVKYLLNEEYITQFNKGNITLLPIGKKGMEAFKRNTALTLDLNHVELFSQLNFDAVNNTVQTIIEDFIEGKFDRVEVVFSEFKNAVVQLFQNKQFLPLAQLPASNEKPAVSSNYIYEPNQSELITKIVPTYLSMQFYRFMLDANASEHGARMTAMDKATDNAGELLKALRLQYNRARQAAITTEISEIVGGAAALQQG